MSDSSDNAAASAVCDNADDATEAEACCVTQHSADLCVTTEVTTKEGDLAQANCDFDSDEPHQPNQVNQLTEQIRSHLNIDKSKVSIDETKQDSTIPKEPESYMKLPETEAGLEELYESILESSCTQQGSSFTQKVDPDKVSKDLTLEGFASDITRKMGLHVPVVHLNSKNYCTRMQMNDGGMNYVSLLKGGGPRLWLIVPREYNKKLEKVAGDILKRSMTKPRAKLYDQWLPSCHTPLMHKMIAIGPTQLRNSGIPFKIAPQYPGDLIHVLHHTLHQVVDVGSSIVETANVGNNLWLENAFEFDMCACNHQGVRALDLDSYKDIIREHYMKARKNAKTGRSKKK